MILYSVYINDVECPKLVFQTYQEEKAKTFINKYNSINLVDDWDKAFISENEISPETVEEKADKEISEYKEYFGIEMILMKYL